MIYTADYAEVKPGLKVYGKSDDDKLISGVVTNFYHGVHLESLTMVCIDWAINGKVKNINHSKYEFDFIYADKNAAIEYLIGVLRSKANEILDYITELENDTNN